MNYKLFESILKEIKFSASRSSGPGGQHVNKVNTRVTLSWDIANSEVLDEAQKELLSDKLGSKITGEGVLMLSSQNARSQLQNKQKVVEKLNKLIGKALLPRKKRKKTKPTKSSVEKRLQDKKKLSEKKRFRKGLK